jgi:hypothetical protein
MEIPLATNLIHFHLNKLFKNMVCILELFCLATVLATFQKIGQIFFQCSGHTAPYLKMRFLNTTHRYLRGVDWSRHIRFQKSITT